MVLSLDKWFWWHEYWFPTGYSWEDMKESADISYPKPRDLLLIIPCVPVLVGVRYLFQRFPDRHGTSLCFAMVAAKLITEWCRKVSCSGEGYKAATPRNLQERSAEYLHQSFIKISQENERATAMHINKIHCTAHQQKAGVRDKVRLKAEPNPLLEKFYTMHSKKPKEGQLISLSKQCDMPTKHVERWFRYRRNQDRPSLTTKFCSVSWSSLCYLISFCTGLVVLHDKPWFWDSRECWIGYPQQPLQRSIYWYYMMEFSFALAMTCTMAFDVKRKDFKEQMVHHAATLILISHSYCANYLRIGTLVMLLHASATVLLELTKLFLYLNWTRTSQHLFLVFSSVFLVTRFILFPYRVLYFTIYDILELYKPFFGYYFINVFLIVLQLLHVFWGSLIIQMIYKFINGTLKHDARSDQEESEENEEESEQKNQEKNGTMPFSNITSNNSIQSNIVQQLSGRAQFPSRYANDRQPAPEQLTARP